MDWIHSLPVDPFRGATRRNELGVEWWFAVIPESDDDDGRVVTCLYRVFPERHEAEGDLFATLSRPII
jgi:hypothetical protein